jgi:hypothetical protein
LIDFIVEDFWGGVLVKKKKDDIHEMIIFYLQIIIVTRILVRNKLIGSKVWLIE